MAGAPTMPRVLPSAGPATQSNANGGAAPALCGSRNCQPTGGGYFCEPAAAPSRSVAYSNHGHCAVDEDCESVWRSCNQSECTAHRSGSWCNGDFVCVAPGKLPAGASCRIAGSPSGEHDMCQSGNCVVTNHNSNPPLWSCQ